MGKQVIETTQSRIRDAMSKMWADGYVGTQMRWFITEDSLFEFQMMDEFYVNLHYPYPLQVFNEPLLRGIIGNIYVYIDTSLKGRIAELRAIEGEAYTITLDFTEPIT